MKKQLLYFTLLFVQFLSAQNIFRDDFSTYTIDTDLSGQGTWTNNSSLPGGAGAASASGPGATKVIATEISYTGYGTSSNSRDIKINSDACGTAFPPVTSGDIYVGMVINLSAVQANNNSDFFRVLSGDNFNTSFRLYAIPSGSGFSLGIAKGANGNPISFTNSTYSLNEDHLVIFKYTIGSGASDDFVNLYVDPVYESGMPSTPDATTSSGNDQVALVGIDRLIYRHNWTNGMPTGRTGLNSVARTWADLTFNLATQQFSKDSFTIASSQVSNGLLSIKSETLIENAKLSIYDIQGRVIETKILILEETINDINIKPIANKGVYVVEIVSSDKRKFSQKIIAQ